MFTPLRLKKFNPADHGWLPLPGAPADATWTQWKRDVEGQEYSDLLMLLTTLDSESRTVMGVALAGGTVGVPEEWTIDDLVAYIS
jgi:hypothetical protein